jgi:hypothetical protein
MSDRPIIPPADKDAELEREIRAERKFSLSEAIGRLAGPGMMKGVSPISPMRQSEEAIEQWLRHHLSDAGGVLGGVLLRNVQQSDLLIGGYQQPLLVLACYLRQILGSDYLLNDLVRQADVEWGQVFGERPHFQMAGRPSDPDDPYTHESVRLTLTQLLEKLASGEA